MRFEKWFMPLLACILSGAVVCAEENSRPVFLFPSVQQASDSSLARRRAAARREGETAIALHDPQLAEQKFLQYCELTPANLPEAGTARHLLAQTQYNFAEKLLEQGETEKAFLKFRDAAQTSEYYLVLPDIHPEPADLDALEFIRAQSLVRMDRADDALKILLDPQRGLIEDAASNELHWQALRLAARLQLTRREWTATLHLLTPYLDAVPATRRDAELLMLRAEAELARMNYSQASDHYKQILELLPTSPPPPGEISGLETLARLHYLRALVGSAEQLNGEPRSQRLDEAVAMHGQLAQLRPRDRNAEWGTALWCLANEYAKTAPKPETAAMLLRDAFDTLPLDDAHFADAGMLLAKLLRQTDAPESIRILQTLRENCPQSPKFGEFSLQMAEYLMLDGERQKAAELFRELVGMEKLTAQQRARAAFGVAECLAQDGQLGDAQKYYRKAADDAEPRLAVTALLQAAQAALQADQLDEAIALQIETADRFGIAPDAPASETDEDRKLRNRAAEARLEAALLLQQRNRPDDLAKAISLVEVFLQTAVDSPRRDEARIGKSLMKEVAANGQLERLAEIQIEFENIAADNALDERWKTIAFFEIARIALTRNDLNAAITALAKFQETYPQSPYALRACHRRILLMLQQGDAEGAQNLAKELLQKWPGTTEAAQLTLLLADYELGKGTLAACQEALKLYRNVRAPQYTDATLLAQARYETANCLYIIYQIIHHKSVTDNQTTSSQLLIQALEELAGWDDAAAPALAPQAQMLWGEILALGGHPAEAREHFQRTHELVGNSPLGLAALGRVAEMQLTESGDSDPQSAERKMQETLNTLDFLLKNARDDELLALAHLRTAQCLRELGKLQEAAKNYQDALLHYKEICVAYEAAVAPERSPRYYTLAVFELADLAEELNDPIILAQAEQFLRAYAQHPALPFAEEADERAKTLANK